jgi:amidase
VFQSATDAADMLRRRQVSSRELTELLLAQIDAVNPSLNAVVELRREDALQEALMADEQLADGPRGPLLGVPITIKMRSTSPGCTRRGAIRRSRITSRILTRLWSSG